MYLGHQMDGSPFPFRDLVVPFPDPCDQHTKRGQAPMDYSPIPRFQENWPLYTGRRDADREKAMIEDRVYCTLYMIEEIERIFGQKFDDERFIQSVRLMGGIRPYAQDV